MREILSARWFRLTAAVFFVCAHVWAIRAAGQERVKLPFDNAPTMGVTLPLKESLVPTAWDRLLVSRWDAQHYIDLELRGYSACPPEDLRHAQFKHAFPRCAFGFYPGYAWIGALIRDVIPQLSADYALFYVSLLASIAFMFLWTGPAIASRLGIGTTYVSLLLMNAYVTGFTLVTVQTEPMTLLCTVAAFVLLRRRWYFLGALVAGLTSSIRITGLAVGGAFAAAVLVEEYRRGSWRRALESAWVVPFSAWGQIALSMYFKHRYHDPLLYLHAHSQEYDDNTSITTLLWPPAHSVMLSITRGMHEGLFVASAALFLALGLREALKKFPASERTYWIVLTTLALGVALVGSGGRYFIGMNRYFLVVPPLFFAMAMVLRSKPMALGVWLVLSIWHYWNVDLCVYVSQWSALRVCQLD